MKKDPRKELLDHSMNMLKDNLALSSKPIFTPQTTFAEKKLAEYREKFGGLPEDTHITPIESFLLTTIEEARKEERERVGEVIDSKKINRDLPTTDEVWTRAMADEAINEKLEDLKAALNNPQEV